ncbi:MAG: heme ABC transporter permease [Alphaproteobacteria bacterium]
MQAPQHQPAAKNRTKNWQIKNWQWLANPTRFLKVGEWLMPYLLIATAISLGVGLYYGLIQSPPDYQQGDTVRIMYLHVPAAYLGLLAYAVMAFGSLSYLIWAHPLGDMLARAAALPGAVFTLICLVTGALWGKPMWGTYWVWDARLTSMLILFFLYIGYMALANGFEEIGRGAKPAAILALVGTVNLPIIKFSVDWWNSLHQPASLLRIGGPTLDSAMLIPLLWMMLAFSLLFMVLVIWRVRTLTNQVKLKQIALRNWGA